MSERDQSLKRRVRTDLRDDSDRLLRAVDELRALDREKRLQEVSSPPFNALARQVEEKAREVFRLGEQQSDDGSVAARSGATEDSPDP